MNDLIERAIESAQARIYKLQSGKNHTASHQIKAENQIELQKVTVDALRKQLEFEWRTVEIGDLDVAYECPICEKLIYLEYDTPGDNNYNYCPGCGQRLSWKEVE